MSENARFELDDASRFDRLVDGELTMAEHRALLAALDDEPGGWRKCALAFIEAQALGQELRAVWLRGALDGSPSGAAASAPSEVAASLVAEQREQPRFAVRPDVLGRVRRWGTWLAVAASFLAAFGLGIVAPRIFSVRPQEPLAGGNQERPVASAPVDTQRRRTLRPIGNVRLVMDGPSGEGVQAGRVPVYEAESGWNPLLSESDPPPLAPELIQYLQGQGHIVEHEQQYIPVPLDDGRQLIVPVEGYEIRPVSRKAY